jgi:hypothetical protein
VSWFWQLQKKKGGFIGSYQCLLLWLPWDWLKLRMRGG